jgi:hypothetical protein
VDIAKRIEDRARDRFVEKMSAASFHFHTISHRPESLASRLRGSRQTNAPSYCSPVSAEIPVSVRFTIVQTRPATSLSDTHTEP